MIDKRQATRQDFLDFYGRLPSAASRAIVWERDGEIVAVAGYSMVNGMRMVFSDIKDRNFPILKIWREAVDFVSNLPESYCVANCGSERFLEKLGWVETTAPGVYKWPS